MRAKLIYEDIKDILKGKSLSEIGKELGIDLENIDPNELLKIGVMNRNHFFINTAVKRGADLLWTNDYKRVYKITRARGFDYITDIIIYAKIIYDLNIIIHPPEVYFPTNAKPISLEQFKELYES
jgi:hypothetical protein